jgi:putative membrane protein
VKDGLLLDTLPLLTIGKRLGLLLAGMAIYCLAVFFAIHVLGFQSALGGAELELINGVILGLLLSFRNRAAYERWWEARRLWGQLTNDCRNLACKLAAFVPADALERSAAATLIINFPEALKRHLRGEEARLQDLPGFETEVDQPSHLPSYLAARLYRIVTDWNRTQLIHNTMLRILDPHLRGLLDVCGGCERILSTPLSPSYKALLRTGIVMNLLAAPWLAPSELGLWGLGGIELASFFLLGVEVVDTVIEEPFGRERDDLDLDRYSQTIRDGVKMCLAFNTKVRV